MIATFWKVAGGLLLLALLTAVQADCVYACSCLPPGPPDQALGAWAAVFSGKVATIGRGQAAGPSDAVQVTFAVARVWKGPEEATIAVHTAGSSASCGVEFVAGQEYLVYAQTVEGRLEASLCSRTTQLTMAGEDLTVLGAGRAPASAPGGGTSAPLPASGQTAAAWLPVAAVGGVLLVIAVGTALVVVRRRRTA